MVLINGTGPVGIIINSFTSNITGYDYLTFLFLIIVIIVLLTAFRLPLEVTALVISPVIIVLMAYRAEFYVFGGLMLMIFAIIFASKFFIKT